MRFDARPAISQGNPSNLKQYSSDPQILVQNNASGAYDAGTVGFELYTPSTRLAAMLVVGFKPDAAEDQTFPLSGATAWTMALDGWQRSSKGFPVKGNSIGTGIILPTFYEISSLVQLLRGTISVPDAPGTGIEAGVLYGWGVWEPAPGEGNMGDDELKELLAGCRFNLRSGALTTSKTGV